MKQGHANNHEIVDGGAESREIILQALMRIVDFWGLTQQSLASILGKNRSRMTEWRQAGRIPENLQPATRQTLQHLLAVYRSLGALFHNHSDQVIWLNTVHPDLGAKPLEMMEGSIQGLIEVRTYLDYVRGRGA